MIRPLVVATLLAFSLLVALAADFVAGVGYSDFSADQADDSGILELELHSGTIRHFIGADWSLAAAVVAHSEGGFFVGVGSKALRKDVTCLTEILTSPH
ncbi:MAG: hypothetical protein ACFCUJ_15205 [Thiotrichales bacterium]